jgi:hypothetical protein
VPGRPANGKTPRQRTVGLASPHDAVLAHLAAFEVEHHHGLADLYHAVAPGGDDLGIRHASLEGRQAQVDPLEVLLVSMYSHVGIQPAGMPPPRGGRRSTKRGIPLDIALKRAYEPAAESDGHRVLVDRLWPRGTSRDEARLDEWARELAPSAELRY